MVLVEAAANSVQSAINAQNGGALRIELCGNLKEGGTTPSKSQIELTRESISIDLNVIIRPRGGDFLYDELDVESMKRDIILCSKIGCNGIVIGILNKFGDVDIENTYVLVQLAKELSLSVTFHRAFDRTKDLKQALEDVITLGCDRILTSGGYTNAYEGKDNIKGLVQLADNRIIIMPGAGVNEHNAAEIIDFTGAKEIHGTFQSKYLGKMEYKSPYFADDDSEFTYFLTDENRVREIVKMVN